MGLFFVSMLARVFLTAWEKRLSIIATRACAKTVLKRSQIAEKDAGCVNMLEEW